MIKVSINNSQFTVQNLKQLSNKQSSYKSPLSTVGHIDCNAFFAQVEQIRLGLSVDDPVVCVQWHAIIAVSYAARKFGINRMDTLFSARQKCPSLKAIHTAVFKKNENYWSYKDDDPEHPDPLDHKVSLDPYRRESRKILKILKNSCDLVEKASVDECFLDLGRLVLNKLFELRPDIKKKISNLELSDTLPDLQDLDLPIHGQIYAKDDNTIITNYDQLFIVLGSIVTHELRLKISDSLGYTTSAGIARTKTVAKLASGFLKPNNQTIILPNKVDEFFKLFKITDFWSMGGKTGEFIKTKLHSDDINHIRDEYNLKELQNILQDDSLAIKIYQLVRSDYQQSFTERVILKSMNSNKNIRGKSGDTFNDACGWIRIFAADLKQRLVELNEENYPEVTKPKTIALHFRSFKNFPNDNGVKSKQSSLPLVPIEETEDLFYKYAVNLLKMVEIQYEGRIYPLNNLSLTISNFEIKKGNGVQNNIMSYTKKVDNVEELFKDTIRQTNDSKPNDSKSNDETYVKDDYLYNVTKSTIQCLRCSNDELIDDIKEHNDYHYALKLMKEINGSGSVIEMNGMNNRPYTRSAPNNNNTKKKRKVTKMDKTQSRLPF